MTKQLDEHKIKPDKPSLKKQWLWFIGLYVVSVLGLGAFASLIKLLIPH